MSSHPEFVAYMYENDYKEIQKLVSYYPNIETGGNLFGLWRNDNTVVIQRFIGPGKNCSRTKTSFHQDVQYLEKIGSLITSKEGLCNVGEWRSHHQIGMPKPSEGDCRTIKSNMSHLGVERLIFFIATIDFHPGLNRTNDIPPLDNIKIRPYLFLSSKPSYIEGKIKFMSGTKEDPHSTNKNSRIAREIEAVQLQMSGNGFFGVYSDIAREIEEGKEPPQHRRDKRVNSTMRDEPNNENIPPNSGTENRDLHSRTSYNQQAIASQGARNPSHNSMTANKLGEVVDLSKISSEGFF
ncbi:uncharacterized protein LOC124453434 [Xenia sp. Carnegie-2017]|uniref:uncharacterized protein LOC124453434 n=1 Tax=Xenia sp. Carnegie-2017 TaxID=2897299 RepID=UPI001F044DA6|nr:uncharacterized protein LOC124453434 [Xenia sp. Carnegie-2017]